jgi:hypothetical protein
MEESLVKLYDITNIDQLDWSNYSHGDYARRYLLPLIKEGTRHYFDNIDAEVMMLTIGNYVLPFVVNREHAFNSYVCSPSSFFVGYGKKEIQAVTNPLIKKNLDVLLKGLETILKKGEADKVVYVNNWLLATDLHPPLTFRELEAIIAFLKYRFPKHAIAFRSINAFKNQEWPTFFKKIGCDLIAMRRIYYFDPKDKEVGRSRMFKSDLKVLKESQYQVLESHQIPSQEIARLVQLYRALYIDKHCSLNPQLNANFVKLAINQNLLNLKALQHNNCIDAIVGYQAIHGEMTAPFFGYDTCLPQSLGLYRQISTLINLESLKMSYLLNQSSGAASYKMLRRAKEATDYMAVYSSHLPLKRQAPWKVLRVLMKQVALRLMKHYEL